jgi:hypothetical protein
VSSDVESRLRYLRRVIGEVAGDDSISDYVKRQRLQELRKAEALAQRELDGAGIEAERWERFKAKVRREEQEKADARRVEGEALKAMTPAEYDAWKRDVPVSGQPRGLPPRYVMALEDIRRDEMQAANREREEAEQRAGLPKAQAAHTARLQEIRDDRAAVRERCLEAEQAADEAQREAEEQLGPSPTLESLTVAS